MVKAVVSGHHLKNFGNFEGLWLPPWLISFES